MSAPVMIPVVWHHRWDEHVEQWSLATPSPSNWLVAFIVKSHDRDTWCAMIGYQDLGRHPDLPTAVAELSRRLGVELPEPKA